MTAERLSTGSIGEDATCGMYRRRGYRLVARNWRCRLGELDVVVTRAGTLVFCEVKTRRSSGFGDGWEAVTARKQAKLRALGQAFLIATGARPQAVRFDVASVTVRGTSGRPGSVQVELFEDAF